ncbi:hypothetical protein PMZ80_007690 [Knufia obscura]|uniref:LPXTG-motif cell wall anchor domain protein n=1 Tax=Knufia obscura TaxID=1635080 RepID=A0ABR0RI10_9EURO|nr:hypothetical protein PMZ80_007690 [Knufia obscura]
MADGPHYTCLNPDASHPFEPQAEFTSTTSFALASEDAVQGPVHCHLSSYGNKSPSRGSIHSASELSNITTSTVPHLKRKSGNKHMRQYLHPARVTPSTPAENAPPSQQIDHAVPLRKNLHLQLLRSLTAPSQKRPPASHSSYGIETVTGPPPSFDTRRTLSQERVWTLDRSKSLRATLGNECPESEQQAREAENKTASDTKFSSPATPLLVQSSPDIADTQSVVTPTDGDVVAVMDTRSERGLGVGHSEGGSKSSSESQKSEDLFLNIAKVDAGRPSSSKGDKRRSRISFPFLSGPRPATSHTSETVPLQSDSSLPTARAESISYNSKRSSLQFGQLRGRNEATEQDPTDASNSSQYKRRSSTFFTDTARTTQRANSGLRSNRLVSESGFLDKPKPSEQTESSTVSTTAPSTVWDELDDLKSRIRKLELTGKLPPSSAAAMSTAERPRTATTAATTMSSSPKHTKINTQLQSTIEGVPSNMHPLLHEALGNAKTVVSHDIYQKLQATASDALQLASLTTFDGGSVRNGAPPATERQTRRRVESLCRSLTELTIALSSEPTNRPVSRDHHISPNVVLRSRRYSQNHESMPPVTTRVQSRLDSRRVSNQLGYNHLRHDSPEIESPTALPQYPNSVTRTTRVSGGLRSRRAQGFLDGANDEDEQSPSARPVSRAMTDIAARRASRDHIAKSREYTSVHPMPGKSDTNPTTTPLPAFISRRKYPTAANAEASSPAESPLSTRQSWGRISVVHQDNGTASDSASEAPPSARQRRSLGFASRLGSSVGSRLRAAKSDRVDSRSYREPPLPGSAETASVHSMSREQSYGS